jgi:hypothetical protein
MVQKKRDVCSREPWSAKQGSSRKNRCRKIDCILPDFNQYALVTSSLEQFHGCRQLAREEMPFFSLSCLSAAGRLVDDSLGIASHRISLNADTFAESPQKYLSSVTK